MEIKQTSIGTIVLLSRLDLKHWKSNIPIAQIQLFDFYSTDFTVYLQAHYIVFSDDNNVNYLLKSRDNKSAQEIIDFLQNEKQKEIINFKKNEQKEKNRIEELIVI